MNPYGINWPHLYRIRVLADCVTSLFFWLSNHVAYICTPLIVYYANHILNIQALHRFAFNQWYSLKCIGRKESYMWYDYPIYLLTIMLDTNVYNTCSLMFYFRYNSFFIATNFWHDLFSLVSETCSNSEMKLIDWLEHVEIAFLYDYEIKINLFNSIINNDTSTK